MIGVGKYLARAIDYEFGKTSTGTDQVGILLTILNEETREPVGENITAYRYFTDKAAEYAIRDLRTCGWVGDDMDRMKDDGFGSVDVVIDVAEKTWDGKTRLEVKSIFQEGGTGIAMKSKMGDGERSSLAARMRGLIVSSKPQATVKPPF